MSEPGFREIQLNTKQVVFLFIAVVTAAVGIFLLGVSVGRGVTPERAQADAALPVDPAADVKASGTMPPATSPKPDELKYHDELQGKGEAKAGATPPPTPPDAPPETTPAAKPAPPTTPVPKPTPTATPSPVPAASAGHYVQVDSFGSRTNAERRMSELKAKGVTAAYIFDAGGSGARYKVRVGPFPDRASAESMAARLRKEGYRPSVSR